MQAGFVRYGEERILFRDSTESLPEAWSDERAVACGIRPGQPLDALALARLYSTVTPQPVQRLEAYRSARLGAPGSRLAGAPLEPHPDPALRRYRGVRPGRAGRRLGPDGLSALIQVAVAKEDQPHYLRILARPESDVGAAGGVSVWE